jgi:DNA polymerase-4
VTLKLRYNDFHTITRAKSFAEPVLDRALFTEAGHGLLLALCPVDRPVRLLGLTLSGLEQPGDPRTGQLGLGL